MALALPAPTRPAPTRVFRSTPHLVLLPVEQTHTALELRMQQLADEHAQHAAGPVFPCPRCFQPGLPFGG